jgi:hypothetical protein
MLRLLVTVNVVSSSPILATLMKEAIRSSVTSVLTKATRYNMPGHIVLQSRLNLRGWTKQYHVRFEVFTAVTMKNGVFWDESRCLD